jgi:hypothetical protein
MDATLTRGVLALVIPACAGYTQPPNPKDKRFVWGRPGEPAFKTIPNAFTIHSATTTSVILARARGAHESDYEPAEVTA